MASAEHLLNEAQYAFASISFGESASNARHRARAKSLCRRIIRQYPTSMEASEARTVLKRLGEESFVPKMPDRYRHMTRASHHVDEGTTPAAVSVDGAGDAALDWAGLVALVLKTPRIVLAVIAVALFVLISLFGPLLLFALVAFIAVTGPLRSILGRGTREQVNELVARINQFIAERRREGAGLT